MILRLVRRLPPREKYVLALLSGLALLVGVASGVNRYEQPTTLLGPISPGTTSSLTRRPPSPPPTPLPAPRLLFLGDLMYDRNIRIATRQNGHRWPLQPLEPLLQEHDLVVATLEGPITGNPSRSEGSVPGSTSNFIFTFPLETATALAEQGNFALNIGNNHILNQGAEGVDTTKQTLSDAGLSYFGWTSLESSPSERVHLATVQGVTFALVNFNQFIPEGEQKTLEDLAWAESQPNVSATILVPHWGNEYQPIANQVIRDWAEEFIAAGADLIIGSHPHVVQNFDNINGVPIYFSLGNTVFDQYFSPETMTGLAVSATWNAEQKTWEFEEHPLAIERGGQTKLK